MATWISNVKNVKTMDLLLLIFVASNKIFPRIIYSPNNLSKISLRHLGVNKIHPVTITSIG